MWEFRAERTVEVGGNCTGLSVIESAIDRVLEELEQHGERMTPEIILTSPSGDQLECSDDDERWDEWLKDMLISAEIIAIRPDRDLFAKARAKEENPKLTGAERPVE